MITLFIRASKSLLRSGAVRQSAIMTAGNLITGVVMAAAFILVSREFGPEKFGIFSVSLALMALLTRIPDMGMSQLMLKMLGNWYGQEKKIKDFLANIVYWKLWLSAGLLGVGIAAIPLLQHVLRYPYPALLVLTILGSVGIGIYDYVSVILAARHEFLWVSVLSIAQAFLKAAGFFLLLILGLKMVFPLAMVYYVAPPLVGLAAAWYFRSHILLRPRAASPELKQEIWTFALHAAAGSLFTTVISNVDVLLVQSALSPFETGVYSAAGRVAVFVAFLASAVSGVLNNRVSRYTRRQDQVLYLKKSTLLVLVSILGFVVFLPLAPWVILLTIGMDYISGLNALILLVLNAFLSLALVPYIAFFYAVNRPTYFSIAGGIQVVIILLGNALFLESTGILAAALVRVVATLTLAGYTAWSIWKELRVPSLNDRI